MDCYQRNGKRHSSRKYANVYCKPRPGGSPPTIASVQTTTPTSAVVRVVPPTSGGPYARYLITVCSPATSGGTRALLANEGNSTAAVSSASIEHFSGGHRRCVTVRCTNPKACAVSGLAPNTAYCLTVCLRAWRS